MHDRQGLIGWTLTDLPGEPSPFALAPTFEDDPMARGAKLPSDYIDHSWLSSFEANPWLTGASLLRFALRSDRPGRYGAALYDPCGRRPH